MGSPTDVTVEMPADVRARLEDLIDRGLYVQAYGSVKEYGPLTSWSGPEALIMAIRLASHLGSSSLSMRVSARAAKKYPTHPGVQYYHTFTVLEWRGPLPAWNRLVALGELSGATPEQQADLYALRAQVAGSLRDFQTAEHWLLKAEQLHPNDAWLAIQRTYLLEAQDRYAEALEAARQAMKLHPHPYYRPGVIAQAQALQYLNRDREALELLQEASLHLESSSVETLLFALQVEMQMTDEALKTLERYERLTPLRQKGTDEWLRAQRCRLMHLAGRPVEALQLAKSLEDEFHKAIAARLEDPQHQPKRVVLPVGFVRQNYKTCAPATLAALGRFWKSPTDHLQLVAEICYDGTPQQKQREWAEKNGWTVREFKLTWEAATALLDEGIPFALTTVDTANAHLQAVVGYDTIRGTLLLRDPYNPYLREVEAKVFLEHYASSGPRGFAMVPAGEAKRLQALTLPETGHYDLLYELERALARFEREQAIAVLKKLEALDSGHRLTWTARRSIAYLDGDLKENERSVDALRKLFPKDGNLLLSKLSFLRSGPRQEHIEFLASLCREKAPEPIFLQQLASELQTDARQEKEAERLLKKSLRGRPYEAVTMQVLADLRWQQRQIETAYDLYRFAASLEDKREEPVRALFAASRHLRRHHEMIAFLRDRFARFGRYSHLSLVTLFWAEVEMSETAQAFKHLVQALEWRPDDAELRCFAADVAARFGRYDEAQRHLAAARGRTREIDWRRTAAQVASMEGKRAVALTLWREVLQAEPMARDAHEAVLQLTAETEGPQALGQHLERLQKDFPYSIDLQQLVVGWWRRDDLVKAISAAEQLVESQPTSSWARRELADMLAESDQTERALQEAELALKMEPNVPYGYCIRGFVHRKMQRHKEAAADFKQALQLAVDNDYAMRSLLEGCADHAEKKIALEFIQQELLRQVTFGGGLLVFRELAHPILEPAQLLDFLRKAHHERPDLWQSWSALMLHLAFAGQLNEASQLANQATGRFSLSPRMWVDAAQIKRMQENSAEEIEHLEIAVKLNPGWQWSAQQLAEAYERVGDFWKARRVIEAAVVHQPLNGSLHELLAHFTWRTGDRDEALARLRKGLEIDPDMMWSWDQLRNWAKDRGYPGLAEETVRNLVANRSGEARSWLLLVQLLEGEETLAEREAAVEKALQLRPRSLWAHTTKVNLLLDSQRLQEALKACRPDVYAGDIPRDLLRLEARVERSLGNTAGAMTLLERLLEAHPDYLEGWRLKASWHGDADEYEKAAQAADKIARLDPMEPVAWGYKGIWELERGRKEAAINCFRKGYELSPGYSFAGYRLFDLLLEMGQTVAAAEVLHSLRKHTPGPGVLCRDISLAVAREERHRVMDLLARLAQAEEVQAHHLDLAWEVVSGAGLAEKGLLQLQKCIVEGSANAASAEKWMKLHVRKANWSRLYLIESQTVPQKLKEAALQVWLDAFSEEARNKEDNAVSRFVDYQYLKKCLSRFGEILQGNNDLWGAVIYALISIKNYRRAAKWISGWENRKGMELWMLANISLIAERMGDDAAASAAYAAGAKLARREPFAAHICCRAAIARALAGDATEASALLAKANLQDLDDYQKIYERVARLLIAAMTRPDYRVAECDKADLIELAGRRKFRPFDVRLFKRVVKTLGQRPACRWLGWELWWRRYWPVVVIVTLSLLVVEALHQAFE